MEQQDNLRANGGPHHYRIDQGLRWLLDHVPTGFFKPKDGSLVKITDMRNRIGTMPNKKTSAALADEALAFLNDHRGLIDGKLYSDVFSVLMQGKQDAQ